MEATNALGDFLRARRALVGPEEVGLPKGGLRREEVAMLAGVSADYYLRLEQGRDRNPSVQILEALARVLRLDAAATAHLIGLVHGRSPAERRPARGTRPGGTARPPEQVPPSVLELMDTWTETPAYVQNRFTDLLAVNALAAALSPHYAPGVNLLRAVFLDEDERRLRRDWEEVTEEGVAALRANAGPDVDDPRLVELVGELSVRSERFRLLWARHDVHPRRGRTSRLDHPQVGPIDLRSDKLELPGTGGLLLVVFHAVPGSRDAELLRILGSLHARGADPGPARPVREPQETSEDR